MTTDQDKQQAICKGVIFRAKINDYVNSNGEYVSQTRMTPLKRMSCVGCENCGWVIDMLREFVSNENLPIMENVEHMGLYKIITCNESKDWETGYLNDWDLKFVKVERVK